jgi:RNA polymerase sigma factor (TIGR02999 family)
MGDVTDLLRRARDSDRAAFDELFALLYSDLRRMAHAKLVQNSTITLLDTTSMVHEAYLRLRNAERIDADSRGQFMAYAAQVMRSVIVDFARKRRTERRGGGAAEVTLATDLVDGVRSTDEEIERINDALIELDTRDARLRQVVEMRFFAGFSEEEIADALGLTARTVRRDWERARLLLSVSLRR